MKKIKPEVLCGKCKHWKKMVVPGRGNCIKFKGMSVITKSFETCEHGKEGKEINKR